jgi:hypothetical protein
MSKIPDSAATRHSMTSLQRQYIDARISEALLDKIPVIESTLMSISHRLENIKRKLDLIELSHRDDRSHAFPLSLSHNIAED